MSLDARVGERALRELYLAPFDAIVREGGVWSVMAAYNGVNGHPMTESPLLRDILHDEWGWDGLVMSDWFATRTTAPSATAALDLVMPGPAGPWGDALVAAVRAGEVDEAAIDDKVVRILRLAARVGALEGVAGRGRAGARRGRGRRHAAARRGGRVRAGAQRAARRSRSTAPRSSGWPSSAPTPSAARTLGGGSATVFPPYTVSPLDGLRAALGEARRGRARDRRDPEQPHPGRRPAVGAAARRRRPGGRGPLRRAGRHGPGHRAPPRLRVHLDGLVRARRRARATSRASRCTPSCAPRTRARTRSRARASAATGCRSAARRSSRASSSCRPARTSSRAS